MNNRKGLSVFRKTPESFEKFVAGKHYNLIPSPGTISPVNGWSWIIGPKTLINKEEIKVKEDFCDSLYKKCFGLEVVIKHNRRFYTCRRNQYKQVLLNIRGSWFRHQKKSLKYFLNEKDKNSKIRRFQANKILFVKGFAIDIYDLEKDEFLLNFKPFSFRSESPKKKDIFIKYPF